jgi:hypothetical protein
MNSMSRYKYLNINKDLLMYLDYDIRRIISQNEI